MGALVGEGLVARDQRILHRHLAALIQEREGERRLLGRLRLERAVVDRRRLEPRRRPRLQPAERQLEPIERPRERRRRRLDVVRALVAVAHEAAGGALRAADVDDAAQEGARREHHPPRAQRLAARQLHAADAVGAAAGGRRFLDEQVLDRALVDGEAVDAEHRRQRRLAVQVAVRLRARPLDRRTLPPVEHPEVDAGAVDQPAHQPVERVDLADEVPLADPADRRVARHLADRVDALRHEDRPRARARRRRRRLAAGVPAAHHDHVGVRRRRRNSGGSRGCRPLHGAVRRGRARRVRAVGEEQGHADATERHHQEMRARL